MATSSKTPRNIAVVGSLNIDYVTRTKRMPEVGETFTATSLTTGYGGKGANQAVACARLSKRGVRVHMVGHVGDDSNGTDYIAKLGQEDIDTNAVKKIGGQQTGTATIIVEDNGENRIMVVPGANHAFGDADLELVPDAADIAVFQLEIPDRVVLANMRHCHERGKHVVFNPSPVINLPQLDYRTVDTLILNHTEAKMLCQQTSHGDVTDINQLMSILSGMGVQRTIIITVGADGVYYQHHKQGKGKVEAERVEVIDTTAAGDTFLGAYVACLAEHGEDCVIELAIRYANSAAALAVQTAGAMSSIPTRDVVLGISPAAK